MDHLLIPFPKETHTVLIFSSVSGCFLRGETDDHSFQRAIRVEKTVILKALTTSRLSSILYHHSKEIHYVLLRHRMSLMSDHTRFISNGGQREDICTKHSPQNSFCYVQSLVVCNGDQDRAIPAAAALASKAERKTIEALAAAGPTPRLQSLLLQENTQDLYSWMSPGREMYSQ